MKVYPAQIREWDRNDIFANLFRRPTPARLTRIEKSLLQAHFGSVNCANITS